MNTLSVLGFCDSNMQIPCENWELHVERSRVAAFIPPVRHWRHKHTTASSMREGSIPGPTARPSRVPSDNQPSVAHPPGYIRPFVGPTGFPDFGRRGWTNQADRLPWRPYGLIRANIISEDARKNRRISENSFGRRSLGFFSFHLPSFLPSTLPSSSLLTSPSHRAVAYAPSEEKMSEKS